MTQTTGITSNGTAVAPDTSISNPASTMGENDFLKLLVAQLQYQDPMNPTGNDQFMQEQAQFSTVEGINNLQKTMASMQSDQQLAQSVALIGKKVTYIGSDGSSTASGVVSSVATSGTGSLSLTIGGQSVAPSSVVLVEAAPVAAATTTGTGAGAPSTTTGSTAGGSTAGSSTGPDSTTSGSSSTDSSTTGSSTTDSSSTGGSTPSA
jgi:flagellar basal-body rod modification protein FlgD